MADLTLAMRCAECGERALLERDSTGRLVCAGCFVPDIHDPAWAGYGAVIDDVIVAPPNAKVVR